MNILLSDLLEVKKSLDIDLANHAEDAKLNFFIEQASSWILEYLDRKDVAKQSRTRYYDGTNTLELQLRDRPVFTTPTIEVYYDSTGYYGQRSGAFDSTTQLTYGDDFVLKIDQPDGTSRCGILVRVDGGAWYKQPMRQAGLLASYLGPGFGSIKVVATAGWTVDTVPAEIRAACNLLVAKMRYLFPLGVELQNESYEERAIGLFLKSKTYLMSAAIPLIYTHRNHSF